MAKAFPARNYRKREPRPADPGPEDAPPPPRRRGDPVAPQPAADSAWEAQANWYDRHQGDRGDDFYTTLILPAVLRLLAPEAGARVLDVCCGQGVLGRALAERKVASVGIDASPALVAAAAKRAGAYERHLVGDARNLHKILTAAGEGAPFTAAAAVMALQDLDPIAPVLAGMAAALAPGGRAAIVLTHPCFRIPRRSSWGFDDDAGLQYRRLDGYLSPLAAPIRTHPGLPHDPSRTTSWHRPLSHYLNACGAAGLAVTACDELCSHRRGTKGPRFGAEDRAAKEFPLFLALGLVRLPA
jgi:SAM-dependent methyltransferase